MNNYEENELHKARRASHYKASDVNGRLIMNLRDLSHTMRFLYEGKGSQKRILIILKEAERITQRELTEWLGIQPGSASEVISKLEGAGYIIRTLSEIDRRTTDIVLTEKGKDAAEEALMQRNKRHEEMFSCLSDGEKAELLSLLEKVNTDWEKRYRGTEESCRCFKNKTRKHCCKTDKERRE